MNCWSKWSFWIVICLLAWIHSPATATVNPCLRLTGVVQDYASHLPLVARLSVRTQQGSYNIGVSAAQTGRFTIDITCPATELIIDKEGYRQQSLVLNTSSALSNKPIGVIIPLISLGQQGLNQPYSQSQQTFFVQKNNKQASIRPQHNTFVISDALTGQLLPAQMCFTFTKTEKKQCFETNKAGQVSIDFTEKDIIAIDVTSAGYQTYNGNQIVEQGDTRNLRQGIRLVRELTILSVQVDPSVKNFELRPEGKAGKTISLQAIPGLANTLVAYDLIPQQYQLVITDQQQAVLEQRSIVIQPGLNTTAALAPQPLSASAVAPVSRPDSALRFEQSNWKLLQDSQALLTQMAAYLVQHPELSIRIMGHTDKEGDERLNLRLSEQRAKVVSTFLWNHGVADERMEIIGLGSQFMIAPSDTEENKAKNRRVTIKFIAKETR